MKDQECHLRTIGWREWGSLPALGIGALQVKIDTGANTSALHAENLVFHQEGKKKYVTFSVFPRRRSKGDSKTVTAEVIAFRRIKSSLGARTERPVIKTTIEMGGEKFPIELSLINRGKMAFRMLLGRRAMNGRFIVNPKEEFLLNPERPVVQNEQEF